MRAFQSIKLTLIAIAITLVLLAAACSPQAPVVSSGDGVPHLDDLVSAASSGSTEDLAALVKFSSLPCSTAEGLGGPPKCLEGEAEGTPVEVLPVLGPEGHHIRRSEISSWTGLRGAQLYAAFTTPASTFSDEFYPKGDFGVAFILPDEVNGVIFQITEEGIVRVDYHPVTAIDEILRDAEIIVQPTQPPG